MNPVPRKVRGAVSILVIAWMGATSVAAAKPPTSPKEVFATGRVHIVNIQMSRENWGLMEPGAGNAFVRAAKSPAATQQVALRPGGLSAGFAYVKCALDFDGEPVTDVGARFKGGMSYSVSTASPRRPMKLDFERFVDGKRFAGLATLNLNNQALDPSQARETLAFEAFRELGVPAPRTGYALVYLTVAGLYDREFLGLYTLIEEVDKPFLKRHFGHANGLLLKPEGMRGLADFGDTWPAYDGRYRPKSDVDPTLAARMVQLAKLIHRADDATFKEQVGTYLDVDEFLRYVAVNAALANFDSFLSTGHNYYMYVNPADGRAAFIPWDMNMAFGGYTWVGTEAQIADLSISHPYVDYNRLIERVLAVDAYRDAYRGHVRRLVEGPFDPARLRRRLAELKPVIEEAGEAARRAGKTGSPSTRPSTTARLTPPDLTVFVTRRCQSMRDQLAGTSRGYLPAFRDPDLVLPEWAKVVRPAAALLAAIDADADGRLSEAEVRDAVGQLLGAGKVGPGGSLDLAAATGAFDRSLTEDMRRCATAAAWAKWLIHLADANRDGRVGAEEIVGAFRRLLAGSEKDFDGLMGGRELVEALSGAGVP